MPESAPTVLEGAPRAMFAAVRLDVVNEFRWTSGDGSVTPGRGVQGMRQRVELLGGTIDVGPFVDHWAVRVAAPAVAGADRAGRGQTW